MAFQGFYLIKSRMTGYCLDVEGGNTNPGAKVIPYEKHGRDNQQFYDDPATQTIRSKINQFCLDIEAGPLGHHLVLKPFQPGDSHQQWIRSPDGLIRNPHSNKVLDITNKNRLQGAMVSMYDANGGENQLWDFEFVGGQPPMAGASSYPGGYPAQGGFQSQGGYPPQGGYPQGSYPGQQGGYPQQQGGYPAQQGGYPGGYPPQGGYPAQGGYPPQGGYPAQGGFPPQGGFPSGYPAPTGPVQVPGPKREFYIVSEMSGKVLDIQGGSAETGAKLVMWGKHHNPAKNQLWYLDQQGIIRSSLNDMAIEADASGSDLRMAPYTGHANHQWIIEGQKIIRRGTNDCFDIKGESHLDGAHVLAYKYKGSKNQHWRIDYVN